MRVSIAIALGSLALAVVLTIAAESRRTRDGKRYLSLALIALCGACVGVVSIVLIHVFAIAEWKALTISIPLGVPALFVAAKLSER